MNNDYIQQMEELATGREVSDQIAKMDKMSKMGYDNYFASLDKIAPKQQTSYITEFKGGTPTYNPNAGGFQTPSQVNPDYFKQIPGVAAAAPQYREGGTLEAAGRALSNTDEMMTSVVNAGARIVPDIATDNLVSAIMGIEEREGLSVFDRDGKKFSDDLNYPKDMARDIEEIKQHPAYRNKMYQRLVRYIDALSRGDAQPFSETDGVVEIAASRMGLGESEMARSMYKGMLEYEMRDRNRTPEEREAARAQPIIYQNVRDNYVMASEFLRGFQDYLNEQKEVNDYEPGSLNYYVFGATEAAPAVVAGTLATILGSPALGASVMLAPVVPEAYEKAQENGLSVPASLAYTALTAAAEYIPDKFVLGHLLKRTRGGKSVLGTMLAGTVMEGMDEALTEAVQMGIDKAILDENVTWGQAWTRLKDAFIIGGMLGGPMAGTMHVADKYFDVTSEHHRANVSKSWSEAARALEDLYKQNGIDFSGNQPAAAPQAQTTPPPASQPAAAPQVQPTPQPASQPTPQPAAATASQPTTQATTPSVIPGTNLPVLDQNQLNAIAAVNANDEVNIRGRQTALLDPQIPEATRTQFTQELQQYHQQYANQITPPSAPASSPRQQELFSAGQTQPQASAPTWDEAVERDFVERRFGKKLADSIEFGNTLPDGSPLNQEGYTASNGRIIINPEAIQEWKDNAGRTILSRSERMAMVIGHELRHNADLGIIKNYPAGQEQLSKFLKELAGNNAVRTLATAIRNERADLARQSGNSRLEVSEEASIREAIAELTGAAVIGRGDVLGTRYAKYAPRDRKHIRKVAQDIANVMRRIVSKITGRKYTEQTLSNADAVRMLFETEQYRFNANPATNTPLRPQAQPNNQGMTQQSLFSVAPPSMSPEAQQLISRLDTLIETGQTLSNDDAYDFGNYIFYGPHDIPKAEREAIAVRFAQVVEPEFIKSNVYKLTYDTLKAVLTVGRKFSDGGYTLQRAFAAFTSEYPLVESDAVYRMLDLHIEELSGGGTTPVINALLSLDAVSRSALLQRAGEDVKNSYAAITSPDIDKSRFFTRMRVALSNDDYVMAKSILDEVGSNDLNSEFLEDLLRLSGRRHFEGSNLQHIWDIIKRFKNSNRVFYTIFRNGTLELLPHGLEERRIHSKNIFDLIEARELTFDATFDIIRRQQTLFDRFDSSVIERISNSTKPDVLGALIHIYGLDFEGLRIYLPDNTPYKSFTDMQQKSLYDFDPKVLADNTTLFVGAYFYLDNERTKERLVPTLKALAARNDLTEIFKDRLVKELASLNYLGTTILPDVLETAENMGLPTEELAIRINQRNAFDMGIFAYTLPYISNATLITDINNYYKGIVVHAGLIYSADVLEAAFETHIKRDGILQNNKLVQALMDIDIELSDDVVLKILAAAPQTEVDRYLSFQPEGDRERLLSKLDAAITEHSTLEEFRRAFSRAFTTGKVDDELLNTARTTDLFINDIRLQPELYQNLFDPRNLTVENFQALAQALPEITTADYIMGISNKIGKESPSLQTEFYRAFVAHKPHIGKANNLLKGGNIDIKHLKNNYVSGVARFRRELRPIMQEVGKGNVKITDIAKATGLPKQKIETILNRVVGPDTLAAWRARNTVDAEVLQDYFGSGDFTSIGVFDRGGIQSIAGVDTAESYLYDGFLEYTARRPVLSNAHPPGFAFVLFREFTDTDGAPAALITEVQSDTMSVMFAPDKRSVANRVYDFEDLAEREEAENQLRTIMKTWPRTIMRNTMRGLFQRGVQRVYAITPAGLKSLGAEPPQSVVNDVFGAKAALEEGFGEAVTLNIEGHKVEAWGAIERNSVDAMEILYSVVPPKGASVLPDRPMIAIHNMMPDELPRVIEHLNSGGVWRPNIAVMPSYVNYSKYGPVSVVMKPRVALQNESLIIFDDAETRPNSSEPFGKLTDIDPRVGALFMQIQQLVDTEKGVITLEDYRRHRYANQALGREARMYGIPAQRRLGMRLADGLGIDNDGLVEELDQLLQWLKSDRSTEMQPGMYRLLDEVLRPSPYAELAGVPVTWDDVAYIAIPTYMPVPPGLPVDVVRYDTKIRNSTQRTQRPNNEDQGRAVRSRPDGLFSAPPPEGYSRGINQEDYGDLDTW